MCVNNFLNKDLLKYKAINIPFKPHHTLPNRQIIAGYYLDYVKKYLLDNHTDHFPLRQMSIATYFDRKCQEAIDRTIQEFTPIIEQQEVCCLVIDNNSGGVKAMRSGMNYESLNLSILLLTATYNPPHFKTVHFSRSFEARFFFGNEIQIKGIMHRYTWGAKMAS